MTRVRLQGLHVPPALTGWLLVDEFGVPRYWPSVWQIMRGPKLANATLGRHLSAIERLYVHASEVARVHLDHAIAHVDLSSLSEVLGGFLVALANEHARSGKSTAQPWEAAMGFVRFVVTHLSPDQEGVLDDVERKLAEQRRLYSNLVPSRRKVKTGRLRALPASVVEDLLEIADPDWARNPFRDEASRWRNYALLLLLLSAGIRRGEALSLHPESIRDGYDPKNRQAVDVAER